MSRTRPPRATRLGGALATCAALGATLLAPGSAQAVAGQPVPLGTYAFTARLVVGDQPEARACSGVLVDPRWVLTAKSCFAADPAQSIDVPTGAPARRTTVTVGKTDLTAAGGHTTAVVELVPRPDRDLVMARLERPATGVTPVALSANAPAAGEELTVAGFGRTRTTWVPDRLHSAVFTVGGTSATEFEVAPRTPADASLCQGDAGGPALRTENGAPALVAVTSRSWQGGCLGSAATRTGAFESRTDGLASWVKATTNRPVRMTPGQKLLPGQMLAANDVKVLMQTDGNLVMYHNAGGGALWASGTHGNPGAYAVMQTDGNFVVYGKDGGPSTGGALWSTRTHGNEGASLALQSDGNLVLHSPSPTGGTGSALWHSTTWKRPATLKAGDRLGPGAWTHSERVVLLMDILGRLSIRERATGRELWTVGDLNPGAYALFQPDGNFVLYAKDGGPATGGALWNTGTFGTGFSLVLRDDGDLVVSGADGRTQWSSGTAL
ncbi:trypsin-like serine protease [Streptomyces roseolilacinus]|uniref:trypsin-like serine protease n=1 Tax=Streptomyces roseolilacinus TaxID=66904 RepID=UPI0037FAF13F